MAERREITLYGKLLPSQQGEGSFVLDIDARLGDAQEFGLVGQITFRHRECYSVESRVVGIADVVRVPEHIARGKSALAGNVRKKKRR